MTPESTPRDETEMMLRAHFAEHDRVSERSQDTSKALFGLRRVDEEVAALVESELVSRGPDEGEALRFAVEGLTVVVSPGRGRFDVSVTPVPDQVLAVSVDRQVPVALDRAGGATVDVYGVIRLRISDKGRVVLTEAFRVPPPR
jgi:ssDNA-binding replication factor A large subunit